MKQHSTITVDSTNSIGIGSLIVIYTIDKRWWRRFWFWLLDKGIPTTTERMNVVGKTDTVLTVKRKSK